MSVDEQIQSLLAQSRAAHLAYRAALPPSADVLAARAALQRAYDLRVEAEALDPALSLPVWKSEPENFNHQAVLAFYRAELAKP